MKREQTTFDVTEYRTKLETIDAAELAAEMSLIKIEYPSLHVVIGSVMIMSLVSNVYTFLYCIFFVLYIFLLLIIMNNFRINNCVCKN